MMPPTTPQGVVRGTADFGPVPSRCCFLKGVGPNISPTNHSHACLELAFGFASVFASLHFTSRFGSLPLFFQSPWRFMAESACIGSLAPYLHVNTSPQKTNVNRLASPDATAFQRGKQEALPMQTELGGFQIPTADGLRVLHDPLHPSSAACTRAMFCFCQSYSNVERSPPFELHPSYPPPTAYEESTACLVAGRQ